MWNHADICVVFMSFLLQENMSPTVLARMYEEEFKRDMRVLRVNQNIFCFYCVLN